MNEVLIGSLKDKVDSQERKIGIQENQINEIREKANQIPDDTEAVKQFKTALEGLRADIKKLSFPEKEMRQLSANKFLHENKNITKYNVGYSDCCYDCNKLSEGRFIH